MANKNDTENTNEVVANATANEPKSEREIKISEMESLRTQIEGFLEKSAKDANYMIPIECGQCVRNYNEIALELVLPMYK